MCTVWQRHLWLKLQRVVVSLLPPWAHWVWGLRGNWEWMGKITGEDAVHCTTHIHFVFNESSRWQILEETPTEINNVRIFFLSYILVEEFVYSINQDVQHRFQPQLCRKWYVWQFNTHTWEFMWSEVNFVMQATKNTTKTLGSHQTNQHVKVFVKYPKYWWTGTWGRLLKTFKGLFHPKRKILSVITLPHVVPTP